jgi:two-component system response regulator AtoC
MKVLIVDDEKNIRELMGKYLMLEQIESDGAENGLSAQRLLREQLYDACLIDLKMPGMDGLSLIRWIRHEGFRMPVIMMSAHGEIHDAVAALKEGAQDYIVKPFDPEEMSIRLSKLIENQKLKNLVESEQLSRAKEDADESFIGSSPKTVKIREIIDRIARSPATVLITGESGTGKEVVARKIHTTSMLSDGPFVAINIGGVPENLLESELFGYEKGAFTGAVNRKIGMFEMASGGTLFLDEIGEMPLSLQVKMLRVLQDRKIIRLGGTSPIPINARIIAATNKNIEEQVREGAFREDLFYRLNVIPVKIEPLRERLEDIPLLVEDFLDEFTKKSGLGRKRITEEGIKILQGYHWPGNVRELRNVLERLVILTPGERIDKYHILPLFEKDTSFTNKGLGNVYEIDTLKKARASFEKEFIKRKLERNNWNVSLTAQKIGVERSHLHRKMKTYGLGG